MEQIRADIKKNCNIGEIANTHEVTIKIPEEAKIKQKEVKVIMFFIMRAHNKKRYFRENLSAHCTKLRRYWQILTFKMGS